MQVLTTHPLCQRSSAAGIIQRTSDPAALSMDSMNALLSEQQAQLGRRFLDAAHVVEL
jgi:hypothetical protein